MLKLVDIDYRNNGITLLRKLRFEIHAGTIHMLLGHHGSGKTALAEVICGLLRPSGGQFILDEKEVKKLTYSEARKLKIELIPQHSDLLVPLTIYDNFFMLAEQRGKARATRNQVESFLAESGFIFDPDTRIIALNPQEMVVLDILKHIYCRPKLLVIDEILDKIEGHTLLKVIHLLTRLKDEGAAILIISHKIDTFYDYVDTFSIIRKGEIIITRPVSSIDRLTLIKLAYTNTQSQEKNDLSNVDFKRLLRANFNILVDIPIILIFIDDQYDIVLSSKTAKNHFSRGALEDTGVPLKTFLNDDVLFRKIVDNLLVEETSHIYNVPVKMNGEKRITDITIFPVKVDSYRMGNILFINDITDKEFLKQQLVLKDKLSGLGMLAMGVAHEINNPLDIILKCVDLLQLSELDSQQKELIDDIESEIDTVSSIVETLVSTSDNSEKDNITFDFNELIRTIVKQVSRIASAMQIDFSVHLADEPILIHASRLKTKLVLMDLIKNSLEAIKQEGIISLSTSRSYVNGTPHLHFRIEDNGKGIDVENIEDIFLPFFSTKSSKGKNMGLGLYNSYSTIKDMNGMMRVDNLVTSGVAFEIMLPAVDVGAGSR